MPRQCCCDSWSLWCKNNASLNYVDDPRLGKESNGISNHLLPQKRESLHLWIAQLLEITYLLASFRLRFISPNHSQWRELFIFRLYLFFEFFCTIDTVSHLIEFPVKHCRNWLLHCFYSACKSIANGTFLSLSFSHSLCCFLTNHAQCRSQRFVNVKWSKTTEQNAFYI